MYIKKEKTTNIKNALLAFPKNKGYHSIIFSYSKLTSVSFLRRKYDYK